MKQRRFTPFLFLFSLIPLPALKAQESIPTVKIGDQVWMVKNLDVETFRNGDTIPEAKTMEEWQKAGSESKPAWCYYNNDPENGEKYGKLYNFYAVIDKRGLAPEGFHVPSSSEWNTLLSFLGGEDEEMTYKKLKCTHSWLKDYNGSNESGFSSLPAGCREEDGSFRHIGESSEFWNVCGQADEGPVLNHYTFYGGEDVLYSQDDYTGSGLSVRCLRY